MAVDMDEFDGLVSEMRDALRELRRQVRAGGYCGAEGPMEWTKRVLRRIDDVRRVGSLEEVDLSGGR